MGAQQQSARNDASYDVGALVAGTRELDTAEDQAVALAIDDVAGKDMLHPRQRPAARGRRPDPPADRRNGPAGPLHAHGRGRARRPRSASEGRSRSCRVKVAIRPLRDTIVRTRVRLRIAPGGPTCRRSWSLGLRGRRLLLAGLRQRCGAGVELLAVLQNRPVRGRDEPPLRDVGTARVRPPGARRRPRGGCGCVRARARAGARCGA
jgi:hypothetical protein